MEFHNGEYMLLLSAGTANQQLPLDENNHPIYESAAAREYLLDAKMDGDRIITEEHSYDTIGNARFSLELVRELGAKKILVVNSKFHMLRTREIFEFVYGLDEKGPYQLDFLETPNTIVSDINI